MPTPALDPLFIAYNTGAGGRILHTICIVRKYFTQEAASNPVFGSFPVKNYSKERFKEWLRVNFCRRAAATPRCLAKRAKSNSKVIKVPITSAPDCLQ